MPLNYSLPAAGRALAWCTYLPSAFSLAYKEPKAALFMADMQKVSFK